MKVIHTALALLLLASPAMAQTATPEAAAVQPASTVVAYVGAEGSSTSGGGLVVRIAGSCVVVTALHVVKDKPSVRIFTSKQETWTGDVQGRLDDNDVATVGSDTAGKQCPDMPAADAVGRSMQSSDGKLLIATRDGEVVPVPVKVIRAGRNDIRIVSIISGIEITEGMSGSPLVMNGVPVAILTGIADDEVGRPGLAMRLDQAAKLLGPAFLPILEVTVVTSSGPLLQSLGDNIARADAAALASYKGTAVGAADLAAAIRQPSDRAFVADRLFESIVEDPRRIAALAALLDLGLAPDLLVSARDPDDPAGPTYDKSLFWHAVDAGAIDAAILLLKHGASPHGFGTPDRASPTNRMILPTRYVFEKVSDPDVRLRLYDAMISAGLVLPIGPRRFVPRKEGKECAYNNDPCSEPGEWRDSYEVWAGGDKQAASFREVGAVRSGAVRRNFNGALSCLANQVRKPSVPAGWETMLAKFPSRFDSVPKADNFGQHSLDVEGFIGVFKDRAWFITRRRGDLGWIDVGDNFSLLSASRDLTRVDVYSDGELCDKRSCLKADKVDVSFENGSMVFVDDWDHKWIGTAVCKRSRF